MFFPAMGAMNDTLPRRDRAVRDRAYSAAEAEVAIGSTERADGEEASKWQDTLDLRMMDHKDTVLARARNLAATRP